MSLLHLAPLAGEIGLHRLSSNKKGALRPLVVLTSGASGDGPSPMDAVHRTGEGHKSHRRRNSSDATNNGPRGYRPNAPDRHSRLARSRSDPPAECHSALP